MRSSRCPWRSAYRGEALALGSSQLERDARIVQGVRGTDPTSCGATPTDGNLVEVATYSADP